MRQHSHDSSFRRAGTWCLVVAFLAPGLGHAANECKVEYGYHTGSGFTRQDQKKIIYLNAGETRTINQIQMNYVKNLQDRKVQVALQGAINNNFTLNRNQVDPPIGFHLTATTLKTLKCLTQTSDPAFGSPEQLVTTLKQANKSALEIAQGLKSTFNLGGDKVVTLLRWGGFTAVEAASAAKSVFNASAVQVASWAKSAGFTAAQTAGALKGGVKATAKDAASALKSAFNGNPEQITTWLKSAGYSGLEIAVALKITMSQSAKSTVVLLKGAFNASSTQLAQWLKGAGYTLLETAQALLDSGLTLQQVVTALKSGAQASVDDQARTMKSLQALMSEIQCTSTNCRQPAGVLKSAGYQPGETIKALRTHFGISVRGAADIAKNVFNLTGYAFEQALASAGYTAREIAGVR